MCFCTGLATGKENTDGIDRYGMEFTPLIYSPNQCSFKWVNGKSSNQCYWNGHIDIDVIASFQSREQWGYSLSLSLSLPPCACVYAHMHWFRLWCGEWDDKSRMVWIWFVCRHMALGLGFLMGFIGIFMTVLRGRCLLVRFVFWIEVLGVTTLISPVEGMGYGYWDWSIVSKWKHYRLISLLCDSKIHLRWK